MQLNVHNETAEEVLFLFCKQGEQAGLCCPGALPTHMSLCY